MKQISINLRICKNRHLLRAYNWNKYKEIGGVLVSKDVKIIAKVQLIKQA
jgi:hypothetical protein